MVLGWKRPGRVGRRRIRTAVRFATCCRGRQCRLPLATALFTSKSSRTTTRFLSLFEAILSSHLPANCTGQRRNLLAVCHRLRLLSRAAVPSDTCCRAFHIEIESDNDSISFFVRSVTLFPSPRKLHRTAAQFACGVPPPAFAAALFTSKSSREATRFLSLFEAILSSHLPANCTG